jgi:hypothetical protein
VTAAALPTTTTSEPFPVIRFAVRKSVLTASVSMPLLGLPVKGKPSNKTGKASLNGKASLVSEDLLKESTPPLRVHAPRSTVKSSQYRNQAQPFP